MNSVKLGIVGLAINIIGIVRAQEINVENKSLNEQTNLSEREEETVSFQSSIRKIGLAMNREEMFITPDRNSNIEKKTKPGIYYLNVFPDPLNKTIQVSFKTVATINLIVHVVDKKGKIIYAQSYFDHCGDFSSLIKLENEANGIYYLKLFTNETSYQRKLIMNF